MTVLPYLQDLHYSAKSISDDDEEVDEFTSEDGLNDWSHYRQNNAHPHFDEALNNKCSRERFTVAEEEPKTKYSSSVLSGRRKSSTSASTHRTRGVLSSCLGMKDRCKPS